LNYNFKKETETDKKATTLAALKDAFECLSPSSSEEQELLEIPQTDWRSFKIFQAPSRTVTLTTDIAGTLGFNMAVTVGIATNQHQRQMQIGSPKTMDLVANNILNTPKTSTPLVQDPREPTEGMKNPSAVG
jgi:hypothetical protein